MRIPTDAPSVGLLHNPAVPQVIDALGPAVEHVEVIPDRLWYDLGTEATTRFRHPPAAIEELRRCLRDRRAIGHGIGLSLPSAMPLDEELLEEVAGTSHDLGFEWYSEHLSTFLVPDRSVPNAQAGMGLPPVLDDEMLAIVAPKVQRLHEVLGVPILLENSTVFAAIPEPDMTEPDFFNRLHAASGCGVLLDLHNLYANTLNLELSAEEYLAELDPAIVVEIHLAGGDWLKAHYTDSHANRSPAVVWDWAREWAPRFPNLAAITFEYHESYHRRIGLDGVAAELELMHELADAIGAERRAVALARGDALMLVDFQRALAELTGSAERCRQIRRAPERLHDDYELTDKEWRRLVGLIESPGMEANCMLYRANRLAPLALNLPDTCSALGDELEPFVSAYWEAEPRTDVNFLVETARFGQRLAAAPDLPASVRTALEREVGVVATKIAIIDTW